MKHIKLFEDFRKVETRYALNSEVFKYEPKRKLPEEGHAFIHDQFEVLVWINSLDKMGYKPMNRIESFKEVGYIAWAESHYTMRMPHDLDKHENETSCKFSDYFKLQHEFRGHNLKRFGV